MDPRVAAATVAGVFVGAAAALHCTRAPAVVHGEGAAATGDVRRALAALPIAHNTLPKPLDPASPCILVLPRHLS